MLSGEKSEKSNAEICDVEMIYKPENIDDLQNQISAFLEKNDLKDNEIDLLVSGVNGNKKLSEVYSAVHDRFDSNT